MKKILFISLAVVVALTVGLIGCEGEGEPVDVWDSEIELTLHPTINIKASICEAVILPWIEEVEALSSTDGGNFTVEVVTPGDSPYAASESLAAIGAATTDIGMLSPETFHLGGAGYLPFHFNSMEEVAYVMHELWTDDSPNWDENGQLSQIKILITMPLFGSQLWMTELGGNVTVAGDLVGKKIRTDAQNVESATIQALGATPVWIGVSELAGQLGTDQIDGCFFTYSGISGAADLGCVTNTTTELNMIYRPYALAMNKAVYDGLPTDAKTALDSVCGVARSMYWATQHELAEQGYIDETIAGPCLPYPPFTCWPECGREPYIADTSSFEAATAGIAADWVAYLENEEDGPGLDGTGILARIVELQDEFALLP